MQAGVSRVQSGLIGVRIFGLDAAGKPFFQDAQARNLSMEGAQLEGVEHALKTGDIVGVQYAQHKVRARVMWACEFEQQKTIQVGIKLLVPKDCPWSDVIAAQGAGLGERRRSPRYRVAICVRIRESLGGVSMQTNSTDVSMNGCYVQTQLPLPVGTHLDIELWLDQDRMNTAAIVRTCDPGVGMGIEFIGFSKNDADHLQRSLRNLLMHNISGFR